MLNSRNNSENFILFFDNGEGEFFILETSILKVYAFPNNILSWIQ